MRPTAAWPLTPARHPAPFLEQHRTSAPSPAKEEDVFAPLRPACSFDASRQQPQPMPGTASILRHRLSQLSSAPPPRPRPDTMSPRRDGYIACPAPYTAICLMDDIRIATRTPPFWVPRHAHFRARHDAAPPTTPRTHFVYQSRHWGFQWLHCLSRPQAAQQAQLRSCRESPTSRGLATLGRGLRFRGDLHTTRATQSPPPVAHCFVTVISQAHHQRLHHIAHRRSTAAATNRPFINCHHHRVRLLCIAGHPSPATNSSPNTAPRCGGWAATRPSCAFTPCSGHREQVWTLTVPHCGLGIRRPRLAHPQREPSRRVTIII